MFHGGIKQRLKTFGGHHRNCSQKGTEYHRWYFQRLEIPLKGGSKGLVEIAAKDCDNKESWHITGAQRHTRVL